MFIYIIFWWLLDFNENQICLIADEEGFVSLVDSGLNSPRNNIVKVSEKWRCHKNAIFDVAWGSKGTFATASGDTTSVLWDANSPEKHLNILRGHSCSLKSVDISKHKPSMYISWFFLKNKLLVFFWSFSVCCILMKIYAVLIFIRFDCHWIKRWKCVNLGQ